VCQGEVEDWLASLDLHVKKTLQAYLDEAKRSADVSWDHDRPRHMWIED